MGGLIGGNASHSSGSSQSTSESGNYAYPYISAALNPVVSGGTQSYSTLTNALNGGPGADAAFKQYQNSTGYNAQLDTGSRAVSGNAASKGALNSGATLKALNKYGSDLAAQSYSNYLSTLLNSSQLGVSAANTISGAGGYSKAQSTSDQSQTSGGFSFSDESLKLFNVPQQDYTETIQRLWIGNYAWKADGSPAFGVVAQNAAQVMPMGAGTIAPTADCPYWRVTNEPFAWLALWGVKQLYRAAEHYDAHLATLELRLEELEKKLAALTTKPAA